jgi:DNA-directed RNA polymerase specialized sigma24 family protein
VSDDLGADAALIARFVAREPAGEAAFANALQPLLLQEIKDEWPKLWSHAADITQAVFLRLLERRALREPIDPPLSAIAKQGVNTAARKVRREKKALPLRDQEAQVTGAQETSAQLREFLELAERLPEEQARVLIAHALHVADRGPALHVALGVTEPVARQRLVRAQAALMRLAAGEVADG